MIKDGYLIEGERFYLKDKKNDIAILQGDAKLLFNNEILDMHTCAAKAKGVKAKRVNGFDYWYVERNNELVSIDIIRERYRKEKYNFEK